MKKLIYFLPAILASYCALSQKKLPEFGKIDSSDLTLSSCSFEPSAPAMKLFDVQEIEFNPFGFDLRLTIERRVRIKIFNEKGYKYASIKIPYYSKKGVSKIKEMKGVVYNLDDAGNIVIEKLEKKDFFKEKSEDNVGVINFTFPHLKSGSVVEFSYKTVEKNVTQIEPWVVQDDIPVAYGATTLITPEEVRVKEKTFGNDSLELSSEKIKTERDKRTYYKENIKSFQEEPYMSSFRDNLLRAVFLMFPKNDLLDKLTAPDVMWKYTGFKFLDGENLGKQVEKKIPGTESLIDSAKK